jgi:putative tricarboxylic transport membrane protein
LPVLSGSRHEASFFLIARFGVRNYDLGSGLLCLLVGLGFVAGGVKMGLGSLNLPGAGSFPTVIGGILSALSLALLIKAALGKNQAMEKQRFWKEKSSWVKVSLSLLSLIFYMIFLDFLGYVTTTIILIFFLLKFVGKKGWGISIVMAVLVSLGTYALFKMALGVSLPKGLLQW